MPEMGVHSVISLHNRAVEEDLNNEFSAAGVIVGLS
jgi:hypothetical protein